MVFSSCCGTGMNLQTTIYHRNKYIHNESSMWGLEKAMTLYYPLYNCERNYNNGVEMSTATILRL